jgi:uncharacterized membrane protein AbrB (regulator of aidB expression)
MVELLRQSVLIQALLALLCACAIVYCVVSNLPVPDVMSNAFLLILGFYFGSKVQQSAVDVVARMSKQ